MIVVGAVLCTECEVLGAAADIVVTARRASWFTRLVRSIFGRSACFAAGTLVQTDHGLRAIETIKPGDMVLSRDEKTGRTAYKRVTAVKTPTQDDLYTIEMDVPAGQEVEHHVDFQVTATHPWRTKDGHWVKTADLRNGMKVVRAYGAPAKIEWVRDTHKMAPTYNLTVERYHTYFVGKDHIWVHNACPPNGPRFYRGTMRKQIMGENPTCAYCGEPASQIDQVNPWSRGGPTTPENGVPECPSCNASKGAQTPEEWLGPDWP